MSEKGLLGSLRRLVAKAGAPKAKYQTYTSSPTTSSYYQGMNQDYRWFRQDELIRRCVTTNAYFSTMSGFKTRLESLNHDEHIYVKERIDAINKAVNMDLVLFKAQIKRSIYGRAAFEVIIGNDGLPERLLSLQSDRIKPELDENWQLTGFTYKGRKGFYAPDEVLYFTNLQLEADYLGLSDIEPLRQVCLARHEVLRENFSEIARSLWAPFVILKADTRGLTQEEAERTVTELAEVARAGKSLAVNESVEASVVNLTPDIQGLNRLLDKFEESIIACFGVPRFLLGRPVENRATAFAELEAYVSGIVNSVQRYLKREVEFQWYDRWTSQILGSRDPVRVRHVWNPVKSMDIYQVADSVSKLWGAHGMGPLGGRLDKVWEMMGWDMGEVEQDA